MCPSFRVRDVCWDTGGKDASKVDGEMSGRDACVQK